MWYFVVFQPSKCRKTHFQPQIWSIWPIFPNDSESLPKVCYIKRKNTEILSKRRNSESAEGSVLQSITKYYKVLQGIQSFTTTKTKLAHPLGPIFGLVFIGPEFTFLINLSSVRVSVDVTLAFEGVNSKLAHIVSEVYIRVDKKALATA